MKILIIEDEKLLADSIKTMLSSKGFEVEAVYDGETGAEYAELGIYDLLILDVMMPKMDGYAVARSVRSKHCSTPILMLTARSDLEDRITGLNAGADYYLTKPFDMRELMACINALLRRQGNQVDELCFGNTRARPRHKYAHLRRKECAPFGKGVRRHAFSAAGGQAQHHQGVNSRARLGL